ncbi:MAG: indole-3-glycerol phosphate synthase, partial [Acidimicrobiia bacterium]|nr:indole-3-glycerol phosphate synthase [Acidimicrobiia bacterium]
RMAAAGYDAILVGEALVRSADPAGLVAELKRAAA